MCFPTVEGQGEPLPAKFCTNWTMSTAVHRAEDLYRADI